MPVSMEQVRAELDPEEPDYSEAAKLGPEALPHLINLVRAGDPMLAAKAVYLASLIQDRRAVAVVREAAKSGRPEIRAAAAAGVRNLALPADDVLLSLLDDGDRSVRKVALKSISVNAAVVGQSPAVQAKVQDLTGADPETGIRELSVEVLKQLPPSPPTP